MQPDVQIGEADEEGRDLHEHMPEIGDLDDLAGEFVLEFAGHAADDDERDDGEKEAVVAQEAHDLVRVHAFAHPLAEHEREYDGKAGNARPESIVDGTAFLQPRIDRAYACAQNDAGLDARRHHDVQLLRQSAET